MRSRARSSDSERWRFHSWTKLLYSSCTLTYTHARCRHACHTCCVWKHFCSAPHSLTLSLIRPVKTEWWGTGVVICLKRGADLHMAQLLPLPLTVSCFSKIQIGFTFLVPAHLGSPGKRVVKRVCVCQWILKYFYYLAHSKNLWLIDVYVTTSAPSPSGLPLRKKNYDQQASFLQTRQASIGTSYYKKTREKQLYTGITNWKITHLWMSCNSLNICTATSKWYIVCMMISAWFLDSLVRQ